MERGGEEHEAAIERVKKAAQANGKTAAMFCELLGPKNLNRKTDSAYQVPTASKPSPALSKASP